MVLTATVSQAKVVQRQEGLWNITLRLIVEDNGIVVITRDYSARFRPGDEVETKADPLIKMMQVDIDAYVKEQLVFTHIDLAMLPNAVERGLKLDRSELAVVTRKPKLVTLEVEQR